jgi:hypothetical protein
VRGFGARAFALRWVGRFLVVHKGHSGLDLQPEAMSFRRRAQLGQRSAAPRAPGPWVAIGDPAPGESGSSRSLATRAQRPWRSPGANCPQDRLGPCSPRRMAAMILSSPATQFGQGCMSMSKTRLSSRAQLMRPGRAWGAERVNDFAAPDVMNLLCRAVSFSG